MVTIATGISLGQDAGRLPTTRNEKSQAFAWLLLCRGGEGGALKNDSVNHFSDEPGCRAAPTTQTKKAEHVLSLFVQRRRDSRTLLFPHQIGLISIEMRVLMFGDFRLSGGLVAFAT